MNKCNRILKNQLFKDDNARAERTLVGVVRPMACATGKFMHHFQSVFMKSRSLIITLATRWAELEQIA